MTSKIEMLPLPLYPTEDMKRAGMDRMAQAQRDGSASLYAYAAVCWEAMVERYQEDAAPAEDVRAVVEEPVAWMQFDGEGNNDFTDDHETAERWAKNNGPKYADWLTPLYAKPQLPASTQCSKVQPQCSEQLRTLFEQAYAEDHNCTLDWCQQQRLSNGSYNDRYMARAWHWWQRGKEA